MLSNFSKTSFMDRERQTFGFKTLHLFQATIDTRRTTHDCIHRHVPHSFLVNIAWFKNECTWLNYLVQGLRVPPSSETTLQCCPTMATEQIRSIVANWKVYYVFCKFSSYNVILLQYGLQIVILYPNVTTIRSDNIYRPYCSNSLGYTVVFAAHFTVEMKHVLQITRYIITVP